jgi:C1A family cysteine protease
MPIRMVGDDNQQSRDNYPGGGRRPGGGGGGFNLLALLPMLFGLFRKNPKTGIVLLLIGGAVYYFMGGMPSSTNASQLLATGASFDPALYDQTEVYEPLADNIKNPLPERVSLEKYCPKRLNQGEQGSCVGWGNAYAARTILESQRTGKAPDQVAFSPSYLYNQISLEGCQGSYIENAMEVMQGQGVLPLSQFPYNAQSCSNQPTPSQKQSASQFKMTGYNRLTKSGDNQEVDMLAMKQNLAQGAPVVVGMMVGGSFMQPMMGEEVWVPSANDYNMMNFGGHCMAVVGYDDFKYGNEGAFLLMNSWGNEWGKNGMAWIRYKDFAYFTKEAYGVYPMGNADKPLTNNLSVQFGLLDNATQKNIPLKNKGSNVFITEQAIAKGTKFKIEVTNSLECYTYLFGQETDNSSYVLFPYTKKHSPYCGITGTRLFPKDFSLQADEIGSKDYMAIVVTKKPIDYNQLNTLISQQSGSYAEKVNKALGKSLLQSVTFNPGEKIGFTLNNVNEGAVAMMIEVDKR